MSDQYDGGGSRLETFLEDHLASMSTAEFAALVARTRPPDEVADPKTVAADALARYNRGTSIHITTNPTEEAP